MHFILIMTMMQITCKILTIMGFALLGGAIMSSMLLLGAIDISGGTSSVTSMFTAGMDEMPPADPDESIDVAYVPMSMSVLSLLMFSSVFFIRRKALP